MSLENLSANLRRLMKKNGFSIPKLGEVSGVSVATISNILNEKGDPSHSIVDKLSRALDVTIGDLYAQKPVLKSLRYRTNKDQTAREKSAKETLPYTIYEKLKTYKEVEKYLPKRTPIDFSKFPKDPVEAARKLRMVLSLRSDAPVTNFFGNLSELGVKQFYFNFGLSKTFGVSVNKDDGGPAIFVNIGTANVERWVFTIFHELGHIILHPESYDGEVKAEESDSKEERDADCFAAEFLFPVDVVRERVKGTKNYSFIDKILELKQEFSVSYWVALSQYCIAYSRNRSDVIKKFQRMYKNRTNHDFKDHYEPNSLPKERFIFEDPDFRTCIFEALKNDDMEVELAAELLGTDVDLIKEELKCVIEDGTLVESHPF